MELLFNGFEQVFQPVNFLLIVVGITVGIIFGAIPGLTGMMAISLCLPFTFSMDMTSSFCLLLGIHIGGVSGGCISAILINIPGTPSSVATTFDGGEMARRGQAGKAMAAAIIFSCFGMMFGILVLIFLAPILGAAALKFGVFEYFSVALFSLTFVSALGGKSMTKGLIACLIGLFITCVGSAPIDGFPRFTFGFHQFDGGFAQIPVLVGIFAISEILKFAKEEVKFEVDKQASTIKGFGISLKEIISQIPNAILSGVIGIIVGILPGIGAATSNVMAYGAAKNMSKHPEKFGTGIIDGVVAPETANHATVGGDMLPMLTLGIPGDAVTAILMGALMLQGITPGPLFFHTNLKFIYAIYAIMLVSAVLTVFLQIFFMRGFVRLLKIPNGILLPMIMVLCVVGAFGVNNRVFDVWSLLIFGIVGYLLSVFGFSLTPVVLGFVLGPLVETYLRRGLILSDGDFSRFFTRPISGVFLTSAILVVCYNIIKLIILKKKAKAASVANAGA